MIVETTVTMVQGLLALRKIFLVLQIPYFCQILNRPDFGHTFDLGGVPFTMSKISLYDYHPAA